MLALIGEGRLTDDDLAAALCIAPSTAATHVQHLLRKTGLHNRRELMLVANAAHEGKAAGAGNGDGNGRVPGAKAGPTERG